MRFVLVVLCFVAASVPGASAESNLSTCLDGRYPSLCNHSQLTPDQTKRVTEAERLANLKSCLDGRYPALCKHGLLTRDDAVRVDDAERRANLASCLDGRYPTLCKHGLLAKDEAPRVAEAEHRANLANCLDGRYPTLCKHASLTKEEATRVAEAEQKYAGKTAMAAPRPRPRNGGPPYSACESGHWIDEVMSDGEIIKLEDGSLWEVDAGDTVDSALWLPVTDVVLCEGKMINTDDKESIGVRRIR